MTRRFTADVRSSILYDLAALRKRLKPYANRSRDTFSGQRRIESARRLLAEAYAELQMVSSEPLAVETSYGGLRVGPLRLVFTCGQILCRQVRAYEVPDGMRQRFVEYADLGLVELHGGSWDDGQAWVILTDRGASALRR